MSIIVQCPHCETKFNVQPELVGKRMRCPNLQCRQVFEVRPLATPVEPQPTPPPPPTAPLANPPRLPSTAASAPPPEPLGKPTTSTPLDSSRSTVSSRPEAKRHSNSKRPPQPPVPSPSGSSTPTTNRTESPPAVAAVSAAPEQVVREIEWSAGLEAPSSGLPSLSSVSEAISDPTEANEPTSSLLLPERRPRSWAPILLISMSIAVVLVLGAMAFYLLYYRDLTERQLAALAEEHYKKGDYAAAERSYTQLAEEYPSSSETDRYRFLADLSRLQLAVRSLTNRQDYSAALQDWQTFISEHKDSPWAKPGTGYGHDILEAGKKLCEDIAGGADDRLQKLRTDRSAQTDLEAEVRRAVSIGRELVKSLEPFRGPDDPPLDRWRQELDRLEGELRREESRRQALVQAKEVLTTISDARIAQAERDLGVAGWLEDPEAQALLKEARAKLLAMIRYEPDPAAAQAFPSAAARSIFCVAAVGRTGRTDPSAGVETTPAVFPVIARGILYALDEETGSLLWAARVGPEGMFAPVTARVALPDGVMEVIVCAVQAGSQPAVGAFVLRSGAPRWYQPLPAPLAAPPVVVGSRVYVPLRDELGTIYEFDISDGTRKGRLRLGQPLAFLTPGPQGRYLYAAAEARRLFVLDPGSRDEEENLVPLRCLQVIHTGHEAGTLRTAPLLFDSPDLPPAQPERRLLLCQADGARSMKLRLFSLPPLNGGLPADAVPPELRLTATEYTIEGWVTFSPLCDGEHLAIATDAGRLRLFRVNPASSPDPALSPLPDRWSLQQPTDPGAVPLPAALVPAEEGAFYALTRGNVQKFRLVLHPQRGQDIAPAGAAQSLGVPIQPPLLNPRRDAVCLVVRQADSAAYQAILMQLSDGSIRWRRLLGLAAAASPVLQQQNVVLAGRDGSIFALPPAILTDPSLQIITAAEHLLAPAHAQATAPTAYASSPDHRWIAAVTPIEELQRDRRQLRFLIRLIRDGRIAHEGQVTAPAPLAGSPILLDDVLLLPLTDGVVYRHVAGQGLTVPDKLEPGPAWWVERGIGASPVARLSPLDANTFVSNDGGRKLRRWVWPKGQRWSDGGEWELRERPATTVLALQRDGVAHRFLLADTTGNVWLYAADRPAAPLRRWRPGAALPIGPPTSPLVIHRDPQGRLRVVYTVEHRYVVCLDPDQDAPLWIQRHSDDSAAALIGSPIPLPEGDWLTTDLTGRLTRLHGANGTTTTTVRLDIPGVFPVAPPALAVGGELILPLSDGSFVLLPVPTVPAPAGS